jgi:hypothetical protein
VRCRIDPRCEEPAPAETCVCETHTKQMKQAGTEPHRFTFPEQVERAFSREAETEAGQ